MNIGKKILFYRKKNQISQEQLAEKIGVSRQTISNWELEETIPDVKQLLKLAEIFVVSLDDLVNYEVKEKENNNNREIMIVSEIENVIVNCSKVQSSQKFQGGKQSPKYALFSVDNSNNKTFSNNIFLGWYKDKEDVTKEILEIAKALSNGVPMYSLKYNVSVDRKLLGMSLKLKKDKEN